MNTNKIKEFVERFLTYRKTDDYAERLAQSAITVVYRDIIQETLKNKQLTNENLTGLIQMFKYGCKDKTFDKYLEINITDPGRRNEISDKYYEIDQWGYTGAGLNAVKKLKPEQVRMIKKFLQNAFNVNTIEGAIDLCSNFDNEDIPFVKSGVYSPWLHYINPQLFPIINNSHYEFREWMDIPADYPSCIKSFNELRLQVKETTLGMLDKFAYNFNSEEESWDLGSFLDDLHKNFPTIWRCATSNQWDEFRERNILSVNWLKADTDYSILEEFGPGKIVKKRWANELKKGDLIVILDKHKYYGIAVAKTSYKFKENDVEIGKILRPCIEIEFLHELETPVNHKMNITHKNPATFYELNGLSFSEKDTFQFLEKSFPKAINKLNEYMEIATPASVQSRSAHLNSANKDIPRNKILYGPPGTGKTYSTVDETLKILNIDTSSLTRTEAKQQFAELQKSKRVFFTTFHQNMAYEDFMEGIKPVDPEDDDEFLKYQIQDGLFMQACVEAAFNYINSNSEQENIVQELLDFNGLFDKLFDRISDAGSEELETKSGGKVTATVTSQGNLSIRHAGRDKPYTVSRDRLGRIFELYPEPDEIANIQNAFRNAIGGCNATAYWGALNAIAEIRDTEGGETVKPTASTTELAYLDKRKIVQKYWNKNEYSVQTIDKSSPFVFIIDEINRGNVAQIFGELITLIEEDKRMGKPESISAQLPYSKNYFSVPPNLHILGTMNTADRSVEALDSALRRRFSFVPMLPDEAKLKAEFEGINLNELLTSINKRLRILKDNDHTIGHAWLWNVDNFEKLKIAFKEKIIPLLQEYFYNDYEKLELVLGNKFVVVQHTANNQTFARSSNSAALANQYKNKKVYAIKPDANETTWSPADFISIYFQPALENNE